MTGEKVDKEEEKKGIKGERKKRDVTWFTKKRESMRIKEREQSGKERGIERGRSITEEGKEGKGKEEST